MTIKIGELAKSTGASVETIRYYEKENLLPTPARSAGNYRLYNAEHKHRLEFILHCRSLDMTLDDIRILLQYKDNPSKNCGNVNDLLDEHIRAVEVRMNDLKQLKRHLTALRQKCMQEAATQSCGILKALDDNSCHEGNQQQF